MFKKYLFSAVLIAVILCASAVYADAPISVLYNGNKLPVKPSPTIVSGRTLVPLRSIMENFGATVTWDPLDRSITITRNNATLHLQINNLTADVNGVTTLLDTPPLILDSRTFVPLRFVSESLHLLVRWDGKNQTVFITDYASLTEEPLTLGSSVDDIVATYGDANRIDQSLYGFDWMVYNADLSRYLQVGVKDNKVVAQYGFDIEAITNGKLSPLMFRNDVVALLGMPLTQIKKGNTTFSLNSTSHETFKVDQSYYTCYFDASPKRLLYAVSVIDARTEEAHYGYYGKPSLALEASYEKEIFDITNAYRVLNKLPVFKASDALHKTALAHSDDMANRNYFDHTSPDDKTLKDRMYPLFSKYSSCGENIAYGAVDSMQAFDCWINSPGHLAIILGDFDSLGVGVNIGAGSKVYYTQHFIKNGILK